MGKYNSSWIHAIWTTKNREALLNKNARLKTFEFLRHEAQFTKYDIKAIGGVEDHLHCLFTLPATLTIAQIVQQLKGSSSKYINANNLCSQPFEWQRGYAALSVSPNQVKRVMDYILNQERHHKARSLKAELDDLF